MILGTIQHTKLEQLPTALSNNSEPLDLVSSYKYLGLTMNTANF